MCVQTTHVRYLGAPTQLVRLFFASRRQDYVASAKRRNHFGSNDEVTDLGYSPGGARLRGLPQRSQMVTEGARWEGL
jgi:hypothetical protein